MRAQHPDRPLLVLGSLPALRPSAAPSGVGDGARAGRTAPNEAQPGAGAARQPGQTANPAGPSDGGTKPDDASKRSSMAIAAAQLSAVAAALGAAIAEQQAAVAAAEAHTARRSYGGTGGATPAGSASAAGNSDDGAVTARALALAAEVRRLDVQARTLLAAAQGG